MHRDLLDVLVCPRSGQSLELAVFEASGDDVLFGVLRSEAGQYPVVDGIPHFLDETGQVLAHLRAGRLEDAVAWFGFGGIEHGRSERVAAALARSRRLAPLATPFVRRGAERRLAAARRVVARTGPGAHIALARHAFLDSLEPSVDAFNYFFFRFAMPRHLVALAAIEALLPIEGPVLDVGCGAGHLTGQLAAASPHVTLGVDREPYLLLAARRHLSPEAHFVCADAVNLPFRDAGFSVVFSSDALSFITHKRAAVLEAERMLSGSGRLMFTSLKNAQADHVFAGEPLSPAGWRGLIAHLPHRVVPDHLVLMSYLSRTPFPAGVETLDEAADAQTLSLFAGKNGAGLAPAPGTGWPHARGELVLNPLYVPCATDGDRVALRLRFPSASYEQDNAAMAGYLPAEAEVEARLYDDARAGRASRSALEPLIAQLVVLGVPPGYVTDAWPAPSP